MAQVIRKLVEVFGGKVSVPDGFDTSPGSTYGPKAASVFVTSREAFRELAVDTVQWLNGLAVDLGRAYYAGQAKEAATLFRRGVQEDYYKAVLTQLEAEHGMDGKFIENIRKRVPGCASPAAKDSKNGPVQVVGERIMKWETAAKRVSGAATALKKRYESGDWPQPDTFKVVLAELETALPFLNDLLSAMQDPKQRKAAS